MTDGPQLVLTLLETNWNPSNTNNITPAFYKVTDLKDFDYNENNYVVLAQIGLIVQRPAGISAEAKQKFVRFNLDLRAMGKSNESNFRLCYDEIVRIIDTNMTSGVSGYQIIDCDTDHLELSDKTSGMWRVIIPVNLSNYNVAR